MLAVTEGPCCSIILRTMRLLLDVQGSPQCHSIRQPSQNLRKTDLKVPMDVEFAVGFGCLQT